MQGNPFSIFTVFIILLGSVYFLAAGLSNYFFQTLKLWQRILVIGCGLVLAVINIFPTFLNALIAIILVFVTLVYYLFKQMELRRQQELLTEEK